MNRNSIIIVLILFSLAPLRQGKIDWMSVEYLYYYWKKRIFFQAK